LLTGSSSLPEASRPGGFSRLLGAPKFPPALFSASPVFDGGVGEDRDMGRVSPSASYLALHPVGFTVPALSPVPRCALTAPFHPYLPLRPDGFHGGRGGLFSVALSRG